MFGALSRTEGSRERGRGLIEGWYERAGDVGLGDGSTEPGAESALAWPLFLNCNLVIRGCCSKVGLLLDSELSTSFNKLLRSLSAAGGGNGASSRFVPDSLALARANTSYGEPPGEPAPPNESVEGRLMLSSSSVGNRRIVEPLCCRVLVGVV